MQREVRLYKVLSFLLAVGLVYATPLASTITQILVPVPIVQGGTGQTTQTAAFNALSPLTTRGDIVTRDATNNVRFAKCAQNILLSWGANDPQCNNPRLFLPFYNPSVTNTNVPAAVQEYGNNNATRIKTDISNFTDSRISFRVFVACAAGTANMRIQYSTDESSWSDLTTNGLMGTGVTGTIISSWSAIPSGAKGADIWMRIVTSDGNGTDDPVTVQVVLDLR